MKQKNNIKKFLINLFKKQLAKKLVILLSIIAAISSILTYTAITRSSNPFGPDPYSVQKLIIVDLILFLSIAVIISKQIISLWIARHKKGSRLQTKIVVMFSLVASIPTCVVAVFAILFFDYGIESWFNKRVSTAISESVAVAEHYFYEHNENIKADAIAMANDINIQAYDIYNDIGFFNRLISNQALLRLLSEGIVFRGDKTILAKTSLSFSLTYELERLPTSVIERASGGEIVILTNDAKDRVRALIKLDKFYDTYLLVGRPVDNNVIKHIQNTKGAADEYNRLKLQISSLRIQLAIIFIIISLLLLLTSIWLGVIFAGAIVEPISKLISATEEIEQGNLSARVDEREARKDEIAILERAFNLMAYKIELQRDDLIKASRQIDARRHFSETILTELSSGVIVLSVERKVTLVNRAGGIFLKIDPKEAVNKNFDEICPEMNELVTEASKNNIASGEVVIKRGGKSAIFIVRILIESFENNMGGFIITFDDITALVSAQRSAVWSDVARRIAHEIKNPLTPIKLAAERIKKKYSSEVVDHETFSRYNDTIIKHANDIGKIVEEFVNFARLPAPSFVEANINFLIKDLVFSRQCVCPNIEYITYMPDHDIVITLDPSQINQVLMNLLKNSEESIEISGKNIQGKIEISLIEEKDFVEMIIKDNGEGFPSKIFEKLTEPYTTTKIKGTGLGLAIVKKILIDHNASLEFFNLEAPDFGAIVKIKFGK